MTDNLLQDSGPCTPPAWLSVLKPVIFTGQKNYKEITSGKNLEIKRLHTRSIIITEF
jgi:hypothetical protein